MITLNVYDRTQDSEHSFLGTLQIKPVLMHDHTVDHWYKCVYELHCLVRFLMPSQITTVRERGRHG